MRIPLVIAEYLTILALISFSTWVFYILFKKESLYLRYGMVLAIVISSAYLFHNFYIFTSLLLMTIILFTAKSNKIQKLAFYFLLLPLLPIALEKTIPFPGLKQLLTLSYPMLLSIFILLPLFLGMILPPGKTLNLSILDKFVIFYLIYLFVMGFRSLTFTNSFRNGMYIFFNIFLPYIAVSKLIKSEDDFFKIIRAMLFMAFMLSFMALLEMVKHWHLYEAIYGLFDQVGEMPYSNRMGMERASGPFGIHIIFGSYFVIMFAFALYLTMTRQLRNYQKISLYILCMMFFLGILSTVSRGPFVGILIFVFLFSLLNPRKAKRIITYFVLIGILFVFTPIGKTVLKTLPFIGKEDQTSVNYRQELWNASWKVIAKSPWTGDDDFLKDPDIQELRGKGGWLPESSGGVDIVNSYLGIALKYGLIGLSIFILSLAANLLLTLSSVLRAKDAILALLGKDLLAITVAVASIIATVSMVSFLPIYYWCLFGISSAYINIVKSKKNTTAVIQ